MLLRAYNHFVLANEFCRPYNGKTSTKDAGLYYATGIADFSAAAEQSVRGTVADVYAKIAEDIEAGIPLINDTYEVPKYHLISRLLTPLQLVSTSIMRSGRRQRNMQISS